MHLNFMRVENNSYQYRTFLFLYTIHFSGIKYFLHYNNYKQSENFGKILYNREQFIKKANNSVQVAVLNFYF